MSEPPIQYRKLPGRGPNVFGFIRLWQAEDHVLAVRTILGVELYRRYYFRDIEAFVVRRTSARLAWNAAFGGVALFMLVVAVVIWVSADVKWADHSVPFGFVIFFGILALAALGLLLINSLRGPTSAVYVQTTAGVDPLGSPRLRNARRILARLQVAIEDAQNLDAVAKSGNPSGLAS